MPNSNRKGRIDDGRSRIDHLADHAPARLQPQAQALALALDKALTAARRSPLPVGALLSLLAVGGIVGMVLFRRQTR